MVNFQLNRCNKIIAAYFGFYPIHSDKKGQELNQIFIFLNGMLLGNFLFIFVIVTHVLICLAAPNFFPIIKPHLLS
jgi:hypothetical protein